MVGQVTRVPDISFLNGIAAKHGMDMRSIEVDVRHHDQNVTGMQGFAILFGLLETIEQLVMQNFHFPLRAVGNQKLQTVV